MPNPAGVYPGRQPFIGKLVTCTPAFAYLVSGRSKESQARYATDWIPGEYAIRIKPTDASAPNDPFRHYQAVKIDPKSGLLVVTNSQAPLDPTFEEHALGRLNPEKRQKWLTELLTVIGPEKDNITNPTARVMAIYAEDGTMSLAIVTNRSRRVIDVAPEAGKLHWVSTYDGKFDYDQPYTNYLENNIYEPSATTAQQLADEVFEMTDYRHPERGLLRVCTIAGVRNGNGPGGWELATHNSRKPE